MKNGLHTEQSLQLKTSVFRNAMRAWKKMIPGVPRTFLSADSVCEAEVDNFYYLVELLNSITGTGPLPDHTLKLKQGYVVMLLRNLQSMYGHVNGSRYIVDSMNKNVLFLRIATRRERGKRLTLPRIPCEPGDDDFSIPGFKRTQFPVQFFFLQSRPTRRRDNHSVAQLASTWNTNALRMASFTSRCQV